jgi:hypothetical protein
VRRSVQELHGAYAIAVIDENDKERMVVGAHGRAAAAGHRRARELRGVGYLGAPAGHQEGDLPAGRRLRGARR